MRPEPILAPFILGRRPKHVCHYPSLGRIRYKKLEKVTDVRYGPPPFGTIRITFWEHDPAGMKNEIIDPELCIELLVSFSLYIGPSLQSSGGAPEASVGQRYA